MKNWYRFWHAIITDKVYRNNYEQHIKWCRKNPAYEECRSPYWWFTVIF